MFFPKISQSFSIFRIAKRSPQLQSFRCCNTNRLRTPIRTWRTMNFFSQKSIRPFFSGFLVGSGVLVAADAGLNFDLRLKFSPKGSMGHNLKAIVVALLMCESLTDEEVDLMTCIVDALPKAEASSFKREKWCENEMVNFMKCTEKFGGIRSESCAVFRTFLKSCLQAKTNCQQVQFSSIVSSQCDCGCEKNVAEKEDECEKEVLNTNPNETQSVGPGGYDNDDTERCQCPSTFATINFEDDDYEDEETDDSDVDVDVLEFRTNRKDNSKAPLAFLL